MKRITLLLAILAVFSFTTVSQVHALPVAGEKAVAVSSWLSYYIANFLRAHRVTLGSETDISSDTGDDAILRGDADDYANGRDDNEIDPDDPSDDKRNTLLDGH